jgi:type I restriction enzyme S subunit
MSKLQELIQKLCPNGVEYKKLGDFCEIKTGKGITKSDAVLGGTYPIISGGQSPMGYYHTFNREANTVTISRVGAYAGFVNYIKERFYLNDKCFSVIPASERVSTLFLFYTLKNMESKIKELQSEGGVPTINTTKVSNLEIPLPPFEIQEEVALILDRFAEYAAELQAELQARQEQYEYYRDKLLSFNNINGGGCASVTWMKMSEIGTFIRGNGLQKKDFTESGIPCIHYGQIYTHYGTFAAKTKSYVNSETAKKCKKAHYGDLVFATVSENIDDVCKCVAWLGDEEICISGDSLAFSHNQNPKYIAYYFQTYTFVKYKRSRVTGTKVIRLHQSQLEQFEIPIPPLTEQERIVSILDKFEALVSDLVQGLPAEIAAVQEQYEYYRDKLLSFPKYKLSA